MSQNINLEPRLTRRQERLLIALFVHGESRISEFEDDFDAHPDTLRRDLDGLADAGYVEISQEGVGGAANPANVYSLTSKGSEFAHEVSVSDSNSSVLESLDEQERKIAELQAEVRYLKQQTEAQEHYIRQLVEFAEMRGYDIETWSPDE
ncbi:hypothetical protein [Natrinema sp. 1APR25-10V2]|uniref:hypothetical protein n=1 Tax=Natrinema sp. 1APR25-10V2 TaxID=2951081 RepID=UPI002875073F|nr:hypothetical protein [Natrinema sp. 1APR25-10V2]MDS0474796.1 hypothetical protein [Natrinema sp. 1APR25-10V2]